MRIMLPHNGHAFNNCNLPPPTLIPMNRSRNIIFGKLSFAIAKQKIE